MPKRNPYWTVFIFFGGPQTCEKWPVKTSGRVKCSMKGPGLWRQRSKTLTHEESFLQCLYFDNAVPLCCWGLFQRARSWKRVRTSQDSVYKQSQTRSGEAKAKFGPWQSEAGSRRSTFVSGSGCSKCEELLFSGDAAYFEASIASVNIYLLDIWIWIYPVEALEPQ